MTRTILLTITLGLITLAYAADADVTTTSIRSYCTLISGDSINHQMLCPGIGDYQVIVLTDSLRENLVIKTSTGQTDLNFAKTVSPAPSRLVDPLEWHMTPGTGVPFAAIAELSVDTNPSVSTSNPPEAAQVTTTDQSYPNLIYAVIKLDPHASCVVETVPATGRPDALFIARKLADQAQSANCIALPNGSAPTASARLE